MQNFTAIAQCPFCKADFFVSLKQIEQADGQVRCGKCLKVFDVHKCTSREQKNLLSMEGKLLQSNLEGADLATIKSLSKGPSSFKEEL